MSACGVCWIAVGVWFVLPAGVAVWFLAALFLAQEIDN